MLVKVYHSTFAAIFIMYPTMEGGVSMEKDIEKIENIEKTTNSSTPSKKILVLFTGGTIGSTLSSNGIISVAGDGRFELIAAYRKVFGSDVSFECRQILNILSENMLPACWERIIEILSNVDTSNYAGIILTHGSDTLAYTSALLGMYFRHIDIPLYIIAANKPVGSAGSNGLYNFSCAVKNILENKYAGIFTLYEKVYISTRLLPADTCLDRFTAYGEDPHADFTVHKGINEKWLKQPKEKLFRKALKFEKNIMKIDGYPAMDFSNYSLDGKPAAVLFSPYHSGTACTETKFGDNYSFCRFIEKCLVNDIRVYICGIKKDRPMYDTLSKIIKTGCIPMYSISDVAAYMKLLIAYNQKEYYPSEVLKKNLYFEIVGEKISQ